MEVNVVFHVFQAANGSYPNGVNLTIVQDAFDQLVQDYGPHNVLWKLGDIKFVENSAYYCIAPYSSTNQQWLNQVNALKEQYAYQPDKYLNVFITCQTPGTAGTLLGFGTFPWDKAALTNLGGVWMNSLAVGTGLRTLTHEMGHNLGLWHTFHGVSEMFGGCLNPCYENYHSPTDSKANLVGDFCADTAATPTNYQCAPPSGSDCYGVSWGQTDFSNFMGYSGDPCMNHFTDQQVGRIHCWGCSMLNSLMPYGCAES